LEHVEEIIAKLVNDEDVTAVEEEMRNFREEYSDTIERNRRRLNPDEKWIKEILDEEEKLLARNLSEVQPDVSFYVDA
jgi:hypothetical protein